MASTEDERESETSSVINIRKFLYSWDENVTELSLPSCDRQQTAHIANQMGISEDLAEELSVVCGSESLKCGDESLDKRDLLKMKGVPKEMDLTCVKYQERELEHRKMVDYKLFVMNKMKYRMLDVMQMPPNSELPSEQEDMVPRPNVIITVKVFRPRINPTFMPKGEVFQLLGTQRLTDLRDCISCVKDDAIAGEFSDFPNYPMESLPTARDIYKSAMFFIENAFYDDMRHEDNRRYSEPILKWAREKKHESYSEFRSFKMEATCFLDLSVQLGVPYLYQHQGNCEHIVMFTDIRLLHSEDPQSVKMYPYMLSMTVTRRTICRACSIESARWMVYDSQLTPESPCLMCHSCFTMLHYDHNQQKICSFRAYKYRQKLAVTL